MSYEREWGGEGRRCVWFAAPLFFDDDDDDDGVVVESPRFNPLAFFLLRLAVCICRLLCNWRRHFKQIPLLPTPLPPPPPPFSHAALRRRRRKQDWKLASIINDRGRAQVFTFTLVRPSVRSETNQSYRLRRQFLRESKKINKITHTQSEQQLCGCKFRRPEHVCHRKLLLLFFLYTAWVIFLRKCRRELAITVEKSNETNFSVFASCCTVQFSTRRPQWVPSFSFVYFKD